MTIRPLFMLALILGLSSAASESQPPETAKAPEPAATKGPGAPPFLAIHHYNPASDEAHRKLLGFLAELNEAVARTGLAKTEYVAWEVTGEQSGDFGYVFGSLWPDRATYDAVHEHEVYKAVVARFMETGLEPFAAELYNRYILLNPPSGGAPPVRGDLLAMNALNLGSAEEVERFAAILEEGTAAIARAGHPETRYDLWKIAEDQKGPFGYLFGSIWADREAYEAVHAHPAHLAFMERYGGVFKILVKEEFGNRYRRIRVNRVK